MSPSIIAKPRQLRQPRRCFSTRNGEPDPKKSRDSALSVGVPGTVAGLALAHAKYGSGKLSLAELIEPAIELARKGVEVVDDIADTLPLAQTAHRALAFERTGFFSTATAPCWCRDRICCSLISRSRFALSRRTDQRDFYEGPVAEKIAAAVRKAGGIMTQRGS